MLPGSRAGAWRLGSFLCCRRQPGGWREDAWAQGCPCWRFCGSRVCLGLGEAPRPPGELSPLAASLRIPCSASPAPGSFWKGSFSLKASWGPGLCVGGSPLSLRVIRLPPRPSGRGSGVNQPVPHTGPSTRAKVFAALVTAPEGTRHPSVPLSRSQRTLGWLWQSGSSPGGPRVTAWPCVMLLSPRAGPAPQSWGAIPPTMWPAGPISSQARRASAHRCCPEEAEGSPPSSVLEGRPGIAPGASWEPLAFILEPLSLDPGQLVCTQRGLR